MRKMGFIGEQQINLIKGYAGVLSWLGGVRKKRFTDIELIFYSTVFQSGIEQYLLPESVSGKTSSAEFVKARTKYISTQKSKALIDLDEIFLHYLPSLPDIYNMFHRYSDIKPQDDKNSEPTVTENEDISVHEQETYTEVEDLIQSIRGPVAVATLHAFLTELIMAMENTSSMITISGIPVLDDVSTILPDEVLVPIKNLLSCITPEQAVVLNPTHSINKEHMSMFNEIISSPQFIRYSGAQFSLEDAQLPAQSCISKISAMATNVFESSSRITSLKEISLGIMSLTEQIVDAKFGKIPSTLTKALNLIFGNMLTKVLEERRRVVIYNFADSMSDVFKSNALRLIDGVEISSNQAQQR